MVCLPEEISGKGEKISIHLETVSSLQDCPVTAQTSSSPCVGRMDAPTPVPALLAVWASKTSSLSSGRASQRTHVILTPAPKTKGKSDGSSSFNWRRALTKHLVCTDSENTKGNSEGLCLVGVMGSWLVACCVTGAWEGRGAAGAARGRPSWGDIRLERWVGQCGQGLQCWWRRQRAKILTAGNEEIAQCMLGAIATAL